MEFGDYSNIGEDNPYVFGQQLRLSKVQVRDDPIRDSWH